MKNCTFTLILTLALITALFTSCGQNKHTQTSTTTATTITDVQPVDVETSYNNIPILDYPESIEEYTEAARTGKFLTNEDIVEVFEGATVEDGNLVIYGEKIVAPIAYKNSLNHTVIFAVDDVGTIREYSPDGGKITIGFIHVSEDKPYDLLESNTQHCIIRLLDTGEIQEWSWGKRVS